MTSSSPPCTLTPLGSPRGVNRNGDADALGEVDALQVGVQQGALDGIDLLVDDHDGGGLAARDRQREDGVVAGGAADDLADLAGADRDG